MKEGEKIKIKKQEFEFVKKYTHYYLFKNTRSGCNECFTNREMYFILNKKPDLYR